jgi:hypothetical protein
MQHLSRKFVVMAAVYPLAHWVGFALWRHFSGGVLPMGLTTPGLSLLASLSLAAVLSGIAVILILYDILMDKLNIGWEAVALFFVCGVCFLALGDPVQGKAEELQQREPSKSSVRDAVKRGDIHQTAAALSKPETDPSEANERGEGARAAALQADHERSGAPTEARFHADD